MNINSVFKIHNILPVVYSICQCSIFCAIAPKIPNNTIFVLGIISIVYLLGGKNKTINKNIIWFSLYLALTILLASPDPIFRSWERLVLFYSVSLIGLPLIQDYKAVQFRKKCFYTYIISFILLGIISFFCKFLGINYMVVHGEHLDEFINIAGKFSGITKHSMILGPLAGIASIYFTYLTYKTRKAIFIIGTLICIGSVLFSASRGAFLAMVFGQLYLLYKNSSDKKSYFKTLISISLILAITFQWWGKGLVLLQEKQAGKFEEYGLFDSRTDKVKYRIQEFIASPVYGVGFSAVDKNIGDEYVTESGTIEPGSSWLGILSQTGLIGLIFFFAIYSKGLKIVNSSKNKHNHMLCAMLLYMGIHMIVEGYIFAAGNPFCFFVMLLIGLCYDKAYLADDEIDIDDQEHNGDNSLGKTTTEL